jgi:hypothetical protein
MISTIVSIIKAISALDNFFQLLVVAYTQSQIASMRAENIAAVKKAILEHDQREAERVIGNPNPGEASGEEGTTIVEAPPPNIS